MDIIPWRSQRKLQTFLESSRPEYLPTIPKYIPKKQRIYDLHHVHGIYTWIADYFFFKPDGGVIDSNVNSAIEAQKQKLIIVLALLHCNSRLFVAYIVKDKSGDTFKKLLERIFLTSNQLAEKDFGVRPIVDTLITDEERSFGLDVRRQSDGQYMRINDGSKRDIATTILYEQRRIQHISHISKQHAQSAIIDRMARTLRDMIFNAHRQNPQFRLNNSTLIRLCNIYNTSPHATLTKIMGFDVTPQDAYVHIDLQNEICRRIACENYNTHQLIAHENINIGDKVWIHQPREPLKKRRNSVRDDEYEVVGFSGAALFVRNKNKPESAIERVSRNNIVLSH